MEEFFQKIRLELTTKVVNLDKSVESTCNATLKKKRPPLSTVCQTGLKIEPLANSLRKTHHWLVETKIRPTKKK